MPKKTKRQKQQADVRRQEHPLQFQYTYTATTPTSGSRPIIQATNTITYIRKDIIKTVILGSIFIGIEVALYFYTKRLGW